MARLCLVVTGVLLVLAPPAFPNGFPHFAISREQLVELLGSPDPQHRLGAATSLGVRRERSALEPLLDLLEGSAELEAVKVEAVEALGAIRDGRAVPRLVAHLDREPSARVRAQIADVLGDFGGDPAVAALRRLVADDQSSQVRGRAAVALGRLKASAVRPFLVERLSGDPDGEVRVALLQALGLLGDSEATPAVLKAFIIEADPSARIAAALALGRLADRRATAALIAALEDRSQDVPVRQAVALALAWLRDPAAIPVLEQLLTEPDIVTVVLGIRALGETGSRQAAAALVAMGLRLSREAAGLPRGDVSRDFQRRVELLTTQIEVVQALGRLGDPRAWPIVEGALSIGPPPPTSVEALRLRERQYELRRAAVLAVSRLEDRGRVTRWLARLLADRDPRIRAEAARAFGLRGEAGGMGLLRRALRDPDPEVRWEAAAAMGAVKAGKGIAPLRRILADPHPRVVAEAARALGRLGAALAIPDLERLLGESREDEVREAAAEALSVLRR